MSTALAGSIAPGSIAPGSIAPGSIALVTGASRGIGAAVAIELARLGAHLVLTARTEGGLTDTDDAIRALGGTATLLPLDLLEGDQVDAIGPSLLERFGRLDILVSCAGALGRLTPATHILPRDWNEVVGVNLSAGWRLIRSCGPLIERAQAGRAVFLTGGLTSPRAYWGAYGATKAGLEHLVRSWAAEAPSDARWRANLCDPGIVATRLRAHAMPGEDPTGLRRPEDVAPRIAALCLSDERRQGALIRID